jgi:hypothetical protein
LRVPGQSLQDQLIDNVFDTVVGPALIALLLVVIATLEWFRHLFKLPPTPWVFTIIAVVAIAWAAVRVRRGFATAERLRLGRDGERAVAHYLEWFRTKDFFVFHDVPLDDANIDHVLVGLRGIYVIETKTLSKPKRGECRITYDETGVRANGHLLDRNPIVQAQAQARWLHNFLQESQFKCFVQPVVVFPGWYVQAPEQKATDVWLLEPKALDAFIERQRPTLQHDQVKAIASALSSYIRAQSELLRAKAA